MKVIISLSKLEVPPYLVTEGSVVPRCGGLDREDRSKIGEEREVMNTTRPRLRGGLQSASQVFTHTVD